ncbi:hypothetical protein FS749_010422 [Ceratobasidium sp. UAMH 11750]|nr:hypothetical protein FS749_010422 [Ceratobasidium sp. UAMH 11750]
MGVTIYASEIVTEGGITIRNEIVIDANEAGTTRTTGDTTDAGSATVSLAEGPNLGMVTDGTGDPEETSGGVTEIGQGLNIAVRMRDTVWSVFVYMLVLCSIFKLRSWPAATTITQLASTATVWASHYLFHTRNLTTLGYLSGSCQPRLDP